MALVVFTGGARSGKSGAAQALAQTRAIEGHSVTVAVFGRDSVDAEFLERVRRHRADRPAEWMTLEVATCDTWRGDVPEDSLLVVDCLGTLLGLCMDEAFDARCAGTLQDADAATMPDGFEEAVTGALDRTIDWLVNRRGDSIVVTNEVGSGIVPEYASGRVFRDVLGRANRRIVDSADAAYVCVAGRLIDLSSLRRDARWPED